MRSRRVIVRHLDAGCRVPHNFARVIVEKIKSHWDKLALLIIFGVLAASTILWTLTDRTPPPWDPADHISTAYDYYHFLARGNIRGFVDDLFKEHHYYAPLVHLITAGIFLVFGATRLTGIMVNLIALAVLLLSVNWIARHLFSHGDSPGAQMEDDLRKGRDRRGPAVAGVIAALLSASYHFPAWLLHDAFLDFPLIAIVAASLALLVKADLFASRRDAMLFGVAAGLGMLTKQTFAFFLILPSLYAAIRVLRRADKRAIFNLGVAVIVAAGITAIWYGPHFGDVMDIYRANREAALNENEEPVLSFFSNVYYFFGLISPQIQVPFAIVFIAGLVSSLARGRRQCRVLYLCILGGIAGFTIVANKDLRYTTPILPAVALISVSWVPDLIAAACKRSWSAVWRWTAVAMLVLAGFGSFFNAQWPGSGRGFHLDMPRYRWMVAARNYFEFDHRPLPDDWSVPEIVSKVADLGPPPRSSVPEDLQLESPTRSESIRQRRPTTPRETLSPPTRPPSRDDKFRIASLPILGVIVNAPYLNPSSIAMQARLVARQRAGNPVILVEWLVTESSLDRIDDCDYLLVRTGLERGRWVTRAERTVEALIAADPERFQKIATFPIPMPASEAVLYKIEKNRIAGLTSHAGRQ